MTIESDDVSRTRSDMRGRGAGQTGLPPPLVKVIRHPLRWITNQVELLVYALILAHVGLLIIVALYYMAFELNGSATAWWHHTITNSNLRHDIRDVLEGLLGGFLAQQVIYNHYRKKRVRHHLDNIEIALHIPNLKDERPLNVGQLLAAPLLALVYAVPGFLIAFGVLSSFHIHAVHAATGSLWARTQTIWTSNWDKKIMGYAASFFFGRRPMKEVWDEVQYWFAQRLKRDHSWLPPTFRARHNDTQEAAHRVVGLSLNPVFGGFLITGSVLGLALAGYGYYILAYVAKGG